MMQFDLSQSCPLRFVATPVRRGTGSNAAQRHPRAPGSIDTREKFEAKRLELAQHVWDAMKKTDSRECRNCHDFDSMDFGEQGRRAIKEHSDALDAGKTCIDCHKGIAHELPDMHDVDPTQVVGG